MTLKGQIFNQRCFGDLNKLIEKLMIRADYTTRKEHLFYVVVNIGP